ncbi:hypothetical protein TCE0_050r18205 [Talaromyces pinophilus]|uniref:Uncharacterized protein n=1 Tax=Talaromyces pinophilus TaxID=128442 RepID=A0A0B8N761_TALPI|nr:hypothetical protein TCE0_050r18205 [Talaromyces pinophilus]
MPPKRAPSSSSASSASATPPTTTNRPIARVDPDVPKSKRWSEVSGSGNADYRYRVHMKNPDVAYSFITICRLPNYHEDDDDDEDEDEDEDEQMNDADDNNDNAKKQPRSPCDGGATCICNKPSTEHPDHPFVISRAGNHKYFMARIHLSLRCPDMFDMYVYNDFESYGVMEVVENLVTDWIEAGREKNWKEQWVIVEAVAMMLAGDSLDPLQMCEDATRVQALFSLVIRMVLMTISNLEHMGLLKPEPEIKSLGFIMALYIVNFDAWRQVLFDEPTGRKFDPDLFDAYLLAYAQKYDVPLKGPPKLDEAIKDIDTEGIKLPSCELKDPWGWTKALSEYRKAHGYNKYIIQMRSKMIGGDRYDITTWSPEERKEHSFDKRDPLGKRELDALREGLILEIETA